MWWRLTRSEFSQRQYAGNKRTIKRIITTGQEPGILAYADGEPIGWCAIALREAYPSLERSRVLQRVDDQSVWSITCFYVTRDYRRQGVTGQLLEAAVKFARKRGAKIVEGYPIDSGGEKKDTVSVFTGLASTFVQAGFVEVARRSPTRPIMRYFVKCAITLHVTRHTTLYSVFSTSPLVVVCSARLIVPVWFVQSASTRGFATGDAGVKLWQVQGILHTGDLHAPLDYAGAVYDPEHQYSPFVEPWSMWFEGKPYGEYTSPFIWISAPLYDAFDHVGLLLLPWLSGALIVLMSAWLAWRVRPDRSAALVPIIVGLSSPLLLYSLEFWEHTPGTALAVFALVGVVKAIDSRRRVAWLMAAGAAIGLSLTMRAELYVYHRDRDQSVHRRYVLCIRYRIVIIISLCLSVRLCHRSAIGGWPSAA
jgi:GNAT superfamily N-acetyltransferase